jgi:hypothetical protein
MNKVYYLWLTAFLAAVLLLYPVSIHSTGGDAVTDLSRSIGGLATPQMAGPRNVLFTANAGQWDSAVQFCAEGSGASLWFTDRAVFTALYRQPLPAAFDPNAEPVADTGQAEYLLVRTSFAGSQSSMHVEASGPAVTHRNYLKGPSSATWTTGVPCYNAVVFHDVYPGIGVRFYGSGQRAEYDFLISPGANPADIELQYDGVESLALDATGNLVITTAWGEIVEQRPVVYQQVGNIRQTIGAEFSMRSDSSIGFNVTGSYYDQLPLVIDPVLSYSTYLGGGGNSAAYGIDIDANGNIYVCGTTASTDFPDTNAFQGTYGGGDWDVFVAKLAADGQSLVYSTYLGGTLADYGYSIAVDTAGYAYVTGRTTSTDFPTMNPIYSAGTGGDAFVAKLGQNGSSLVYSTYLGGSASDIGWDIDLGADGSAYVVGYTLSTDFPTVAPYQDSLAGSYDVFVSKINSSGNALAYSTYLGGSGIDIGQGITVSGTGSAYLTGYTMSDDFPVVAAYQDTLKSVNRPDVFVSRLNAVGNVLSYSTYLGGTGSDYGRDIALGADASMFVFGRTLSLDFPRANAYQSTLRGQSDLFIAKLNAAGGQLLYGTYFGGNAEEFAGGIGVDNSNRMFIVGRTTSTNFPNVSAFQTAYGGGLSDIVVARLNAAGSQLDYSTYLGGDSTDQADAIVVNNQSHVYIAGQTNSPDLPVKRPLQSTLGGNTDALIAIITGDCVDADEDGICDSVDNCPTAYNPLQEDSDLDGMGDSCDVCPFDSANDADGDGFCADVDNCPDLYNPDQADPDSDGVGSLCDNCPDNFNPLQEDSDFDGIGDSCDVCPHDYFNDFDHDGICGDSDNCPGTYNPDQADSDNDGVGDACENCCLSQTGNIDCSSDGMVTMADLTVMIDHLFITLAPLCCPGAANTDGSPEGFITMGDLTALIDHLFITLSPLPPCQ